MSTLDLTIDAHCATAPFEQVRLQIAAAVAAGQLSPGTKLPTVRQLAADLGLAANTVARAYRELETDAVIATHGRRGTFVRSEVLDEVVDRPVLAHASSDAPQRVVHGRVVAAAELLSDLRQDAWNQGQANPGTAGQVTRGRVTAGR